MCSIHTHIYICVCVYVYTKLFMYKFVAYVRLLRNACVHEFKRTSVCECGKHRWGATVL